MPSRARLFHLSDDVPVRVSVEFCGREIQQETFVDAFGVVCTIRPRDQAAINRRLLLTDLACRPLADLSVGTIWFLPMFHRRMLKLRTSLDIRPSISAAIGYGRSWSMTGGGAGGENDASDDSTWSRGSCHKVAGL